jgi:hypothetical protein
MMVDRRRAGPLSIAIACLISTSAVSLRANVSVVGVVAGAKDSCSSEQFTVANISIVVNTATTYDNGSCKDLVNGQRVTVYGTAAAGRIVAIHVVLPGVDAADANAVMRALGIRPTDRVVVDLEMRSRQITTLGGTAFGDRLALCVGKIGGSPVDVILFRVQGGVASLDADNHCEQARNMAQSALDIKLSVSDRSAIFQFEGGRYLLHSRMNASIWRRLWRRAKVSVNIYRVS